MPLVVRSTTPTQVRSGSGTQDFTVTGFGTPTAVILHWHNGGTADTDIANFCYGVGFYDGTTGVCSFSTAEDAIAAATGHTRCSTYNNKPFYLRYQVSSAVRATTAASFITDGIQLTFDAGTPQPYLTVILIKGTTAAFVGSYTPSVTTDATTDVTTTGCNPNVVFNAGSLSTTINVDAGAGHVAFGWGVDDGGGAPFPQYAVTAAQWGLDPTRAAAELMTTRFGCSYNNLGTRSEYEITAFGTGQFTVTTRAGDQSAVVCPQVFLALEVESVPDTFLATAPTGTGDWDPYTGTAEPIAVLMLPTALLSTDVTATSGDGSGGIGFYIVTPDEQHGEYSTYQDAVTTSNASSRMNTRLLVQGDEGGADKFNAHSPSFDASGLVFADANTSAATAAYLMPGIAFLAGATPPTFAGRMLLTGVG